MEKKYFKTKAEKQSKQASTIIFFIIAAIFFAVFLYVFIGFSLSIEDELPGASELPGTSKMLFLIGVAAVEIYLMFLLPLMGLFFGIQRGMRKGYRERATFKSTQGITYYRDILKDVTPADLSIVMDLEIESHKDISATLLRLYNKNIINFEDNQIVFLNHSAVLDNSERELLEMYKSRGISPFEIHKWKENRRKDAEKKGLVKKADKPSTFAGCGGCLGMIAVFIVFLVVTFVMLQSSTDEINSLDIVLERLDVENPIILASDIIIINEFLFAAVIALGLIDIVLIFPSFALFRFVAYTSVKGSTKLKRTQKGDELAEKAAGLKMFINDFSTLSERNKEEVMLWDDFLVYAVVLEENDKIINDIVKVYNVSPSCKKKINLKSFTGSFN